MWVPPEDIDPVVFHAPTRKSVAFFGAVRASKRQPKNAPLRQPNFDPPELNCKAPIRIKNYLFMLG
jgi:hypothetical protein